MDGRIILKVSLEKQQQRVWTAFIWLRLGAVATSREYGEDPLCLKKAVNVLNK
jgi:hypothetical protein